MRECDWTRMKLQNILPPPIISPFLRRKNIYQFEILENLPKITGFLLVDIEATDSANKFKDLNWPPLFSKKEINFDDIPKWMQAITHRASFPRKTMVQSMKQEKILLHTKLAEFYIEHGFKITKIHKFIEYEASKCFEDFYNVLYKLRVEATIEKNEAKATAIKLTGNSPYGKVRVISLIF